MPDRLFVLDLIQHTFINLSNLSLAEKQESLGRRACFVSENSIRAFLHLSTGVQMWTKGYFLSTEILQIC